jgi:hypothetical protein
MEFVEVTQGVEFVFDAEFQRGISAHTSYTHKVANHLQSVATLPLA